MDFNGVNPAMFTPFTDDGDHIDVARLRRLVPKLLERGASGLFVGGTTGEGVLQSVEERQEVIRVTLEEVNGRVPVMVHVGAMATRDSVTLAKFAAAEGASAVSAVPPIYFPYTAEGIFDHWRIIAEATDLPLWVYNIPMLTQHSLTAKDVDALLAIPNLVGLKFSNPDMFEMQNLLEQAGGKLRILSGPDQLFGVARQMGATGAIGSTYNWSTPWINEVMKAVDRGDMAGAMEHQLKLNRVLRAIHRYQVVASQKVIMRYLGCDVGPSRRPIPPLSAADQQQMLSDVKALGIDELRF